MHMLSTLRRRQVTGASLVGQRQALCLQAGDPGLTPGWGRSSLRKRMATCSCILAGESTQRCVAGCSPGSQSWTRLSGRAEHETEGDEDLLRRSGTRPQGFPWAPNGAESKHRRAVCPHPAVTAAWQTDPAVQGGYSPNKSSKQSGRIRDAGQQSWGLLWPQRRRRQWAFLHSAPSALRRAGTQRPR